MEIIALRGLIDAVGVCDDVIVRIRKHPKEADGKFKGFLGDRVEMDKTADPFSSISRAKIVVSVSSMLMIEALIFGKSVISYQPRTKDGKNDFILTRNGTLPFIDDAGVFKRHLMKVLGGHGETTQLRQNQVGNIMCHGVIGRIVEFIKGHSYGKVGN